MFVDGPNHCLYCRYTVVVQKLLSYEFFFFLGWALCYQNQKLGRRGLEAQTFENQLQGNKLTG